MIKNNKTCILCSKVYSFCNRCEEFDHLPRWMTIYCSDNCRRIFLTLTDYNAGKLSKEQAYEILKGCDLSDKDRFNRVTKRLVEEVMSCIDNKKEDLKQKDIILSNDIDESVIDTANSDKSIPEEFIQAKVVKKPKRMKYVSK